MGFLFKFPLRAVLATLAISGAGALMGADEAALEAQHDALLELARSEGEGYAAAFEEAKVAGLPEGWLLEAEIVRSMSQGDYESLFSYPERIVAVGDDIRFGLGRTFLSRMQLEGFSDAIKCVNAYRMDDMEAFEALAVSSYEKAPAFNQSFGLSDLLARYRMKQVQDAQMANFTVPMDLEIASVEGETRTLQDWMGDNEAILIDFWASWCGPCIQAMPSLKQKQATLSKQGVFVAALNTDRGEQLEKANRVRAEHEMQSVPWLLDPNGNTLSSMLMIDSIPRMILVDRTGAVLYNGHPLDPSLGTALGKIGVNLSAAY